MEEKKRSSNFTHAERSFLFRLVGQKYWQVLKDKKTDRASLQKRENTWKQIEKEFNAVSPGIEELRKKVAEEKKKVLLTGGGLPPHPPPAGAKKEDEEVNNIILSIMNEKH